MLVPAIRDIENGRQLTQRETHALSQTHFSFHAQYCFSSQSVFYLFLFCSGCCIDPVERHYMVIVECFNVLRKAMEELRAGRDLTLDGEPPSRSDLYGDVPPSISSFSLRTRLGLSIALSANQIWDFAWQEENSACIVESKWDAQARDSVRNWVWWHFTILNGTCRDSIFSHSYLFFGHSWQGCNPLNCIETYAIRHECPGD
jgi:hypothetical protein